MKKKAERIKVKRVKVKKLSPATDDFKLSCRIKNVGRWPDLGGGPGVLGDVVIAIDRRNLPTIRKLQLHEQKEALLHALVEVLVEPWVEPKRRSRR